MSHATPPRTGMRGGGNGSLVGVGVSNCGVSADGRAADKAARHVMTANRNGSGLLTARGDHLRTS